MKELQIAKRAAREAGKIILSYCGKSFKVRHKGAINLVTEVDERAQRCVLREIRKAFPKDFVLAEEGKQSSIRSEKRRWIVDPLDGTTNFAHGYPKFAVSIAFEEDGETQCGVIFDPVLKEMFWAQKDKGAFLNQKQVQVSTETKLKKSLLVTGFPYDLYDPNTNNLPYFSHLLYKALAVRRDGSAALNTAYVACGRFDGFWEFGLKAWDVAAGLLIAKEAGAKIYKIRDQMHAGYPTAFAIANPKLLKIFQREIEIISIDPSHQDFSLSAKNSN